MFQSWSKKLSPGTCLLVCFSLFLTNMASLQTCRTSCAPASFDVGSKRWDCVSSSCLCERPTLNRFTLPADKLPRAWRIVRFVYTLSVFINHLHVHVHVRMYMYSNIGSFLLFIPIHYAIFFYISNLVLVLPYMYMCSYRNLYVPLTCNNYYMYLL